MINDLLHTHLCTLFVMELKYYKFISALTFFLLTTLLGCTSTVELKTNTTPPIPNQKEVRELRFPDFVAVKVEPSDTFSSLALKYYEDRSKGWIISEFNKKETLVEGDEIIVPLQNFDKNPMGMGEHQIVPILCYHNLSDKHEDKMTLTSEKFIKQMQYLKNNGYTVISLSSFFNFIKQKASIPSKSVVITFDDGWKSTYDIAYPILKKFEYPMSLFVYTDMITGSSKTLSWKQIKEMSDNGIDIQSHTKLHSNLAELTSTETFKEYLNRVIKETKISARVIEKKTGVKVTYLAYPYGNMNSIIVEVLKKMGYKGALTSSRSSNPFFANEFNVHRAMIFGQYDLKEFANNLSTAQAIR